MPMLRLKFLADVSKTRLLTKKKKGNLFDGKYREMGADGELWALRPGSVCLCTLLLPWPSLKIEFSFKLVTKILFNNCS